MSQKKEKIRRATFSGELLVGDSALPCYVLEDGTRVFSTQGMLTSLDYKPTSNAIRIFTSKDLEPFLPEKSSRVEKFMTDRGSLANGYNVEDFMDICHAFSAALEANALTNQRNIDAAHKANAIIRACSKIGIIALVDEATGYQYVRAEDALQFKLKLYLSEEMRGWEKTFPDDLWVQLARLTNWDGEPTKNRPRYWGYLVMDLIYRSLDPDVAQYLKENKPVPRKGQNYHQWFNEDFGVKKLREHINRIIGMAQAAESIDELKKKVAFYYRKEPLQLEAFLPSEVKNPEKPLKIDESFDQTLKKVARAREN